MATLRRVWHGGKPAVTCSETVGCGRRLRSAPGRQGCCRRPRRGCARPRPGPGTRPGPRSSTSPVGWPGSGPVAAAAGVAAELAVRPEQTGVALHKVRGLLALGGAVGVPQPAENVVALQGEPWRIDPGVAGGAERSVPGPLPRAGSGRRVRAPVCEKGLGHPLIRQLILEGRRTRPVSRFYQALNLSGVLGGDGAASRLIARPAESHRQHPELVSRVRSRRGIGCHGKPPISQASAEPAARVARPAGQRDELVHPASQQRQPKSLNPGDAVTVSVAVGETIRILTILPFASEAGDEELKSRLREEHVERFDRKTVLARRRENAGVVRDNAGESIAVPQSILPRQERKSHKPQAQARGGRHTQAPSASAGEASPALRAWGLCVTASPRWRLGLVSPRWRLGLV